MRHGTRIRLGMFLTIALAVQVSGCGTLFYPERKGQKDGRVDPTVAILDGLGLLLFLIPGVIAFVVDFHNGTIYLPGTGSVIGQAPGDGDPSADAPRWVAVPVGPDRLDATTIRTVVGTGTGRWIDLGDPRLEVEEFATASEMQAALAALPR